MSSRKAPGQASRRVMLTVPAKDTSLNLWLDEQENVSASIRHYLRTAIIPVYGIEDPLTKRVDEGGEAERLAMIEARLAEAGVAPEAIAIVTEELSRQ